MIQERLIPGTANWSLHGHQHLQRYQFALPKVQGRRTLDLACGVGYGSFALATTASEVLGVDLSGEAITYARAHYHRDNLSYAEGDAVTCALGRKFDRVVSFETIEHLREPAAFLRNVAEHLADGGQLIVSAPNTLQYRRANPPVENPFHVNEPDYATLRGWLDERFQVTEEWEQSPVTSPAEDPAGRALARDLARQGVVRVGRAIETAARRILGRSLPPIDPPRTPRSAMVAATAIMPLLPERRADADVFLFVCTRR